ncbi:MAG: hypothetical protein GAK28_02556 [Luteibacter sp.]|uniref:hypothetical protein n=1 Tax=Luteibacter sp. TaxID=1886636 RepID=UPI001380F7CF|nr:hypothetical protein [Luteibacter sp.]KAF1006538.1 MAG: hypothetical protein GAK28_02556 [Luteibacter sp.]
MPTWIERIFSGRKRIKPVPASPTPMPAPVNVTIPLRAPAPSRPIHAGPPAPAPVDLSDLEALLREVLGFAFPQWPSNQGGLSTAAVALRSLPPTRLLDYDLLVRRYTGIPREQRVDAFRAFMAAPSDVRDAGLFVFAMSGQGQERECALEAYGQHPSFLGFIATAIRSADWVHPIRRLATPLALGFIGRADETDMHAIFPLLLRLLGHERVDHEGFTTAMRDWVSTADRLERLLGHPDTRVRRWAFELAMARPAHASAHLLALAIDDADPAIAKRGAAAMADLPMDDRHRLQRRALVSSHPIIRRDTLRAMDTENQLSRDDLVDALSDSAGGVRSLAAYLAKERHGLAAINVWREMFDAPSLPSRGVVQALAERADASDEPRLRQAVAHTNGHARASAIRALGRIGTRLDDATIASALSDESGHVRKALRHVIRHDGVALDATRFVQLTAQADDKGRQWLLDSLDNGERLELLTAAWPRDSDHHAWLDGALRHLVKQMLGWWSPSSAHRTVFGELLRRRAGDLAPDVRRHIEEALAR